MKKVLVITLVFMLFITSGTVCVADNVKSYNGLRTNNKDWMLYTIGSLSYKIPAEWITVTNNMGGYYHYAEAIGSSNNGMLTTAKQDLAFNIHDALTVQTAFSAFFKSFFGIDDIDFEVYSSDDQVIAISEGYCQVGYVVTWCMADGEHVYILIYTNPILANDTLRSEFAYIRNNIHTPPTSKKSYGTLIDERGIILYISGKATVSGKYLKIPVIFENLSGVSAGINITSININGWDVYGFGISSIDSDLKRKSEFSFRIADADITNINEIENIVISFSVYDATHNYNTMFETKVTIPPSVLR